MTKGLIHIYCGDGKGKTTASVGLGIRAAGNDMNVLIARFLKNNKSSELNILNKIPNIDIMPFDKDFGFSFKMSEKAKTEAKNAYSDLLNKTFEKANNNNYDLLILDEIIATSNLGFVDEDVLAEYLKNKADILEVVMTGRDPSKRLIEIADYVSEIKKIKHPFDCGISARKGIEM
jgi:cob(I)alamin adenosyltransferase